MDYDELDYEVDGCLPFIALSLFALFLGALLLALK